MNKAPISVKSENWARRPLQYQIVWHNIVLTAKGLPMTKEEFRKWREGFGLTQGEIAKRFGVTRNTVQNWEGGTTQMPSTIESACAVWGDRLKKEIAELGPVTLCYADGPMWIDPYGPRCKLASLQLEPYPTNSAALARVRKIWHDPNVHGPFITEKAGTFVWNRVELERVVDGSDKGAPTVRNTIRRLADYILENSSAYVRGDPTQEKVHNIEAAIRGVGEELLQLAAESEKRFVPYVEFEVLLKRLHGLGSFPTNRHVGDVAHAIHGEELVGLWR
jgi:transcriptional regulator with XRE-family HTH domain